MLIDRKLVCRQVDKTKSIKLRIWMECDNLDLTNCIQSFSTVVNNNERARIYKHT